MGPAHGPATSELEQARTAPEFGTHTPLAEKLLAVAIRAQNFTGSSGVAIALTEGQDMVCRASWGTSAPDVGAKLSIEHSFTGLCVRTGEPLRCDDAQSDPRVDPEACRALGISAIAVAPVRRGLKVVGVIAAFSDTPNAFTDKHLLILTTLSEVIVELLDDKQAPAGQAAAQTGAVLEPVALLDHAVAAPQSVEAAAVFEDEPPSPAEEPPAKIPSAAPEPRKTPTGTKDLQSGSPVIVPPPRQSSATPARPASTESVADLFEVPRKKKDDVVPAPVEHDRSAKAGTSSTVRLVPLRQPDSAPELTFSSYESLTGTPRRWWLVAAVLILLALIGWGAWRWHVARRARTAAPAAAAPLPSPTGSAAQPKPTPELKPLESTPAETKAETKRSAFSPASTPPPPPKAAASEAPDDVTIRRIPEAVIEADAPVRRPAGGKPRAAQVPEAQAPQLALSSPELPSVLGKPSPATVAAPVSHMIPAQLVSRVAPAYPEAARRLNMSGKVVLKATITKTGSVGDLQWVSGNELFRTGALAAVKQWRYKPATLNGQSVDSDLQIVLQFKPQAGR